MTTIAVNKVMIAGDRRFTKDGMILTGRTKIHEVPGTVFGTKRAFVGFSGRADQIGNAVSYLYDPMGTKPPRLRDTEMVVLLPNKCILHAQSLSEFTEITDKFFAIGSGCQYAIAAMSAGLDPLEAVKIAAKHDSATGGPFNKLVY